MVTLGSHHVFLSLIDSLFALFIHTGVIRGSSTIVGGAVVVLLTAIVASS